MKTMKQLLIIPLLLFVVSVQAQNLSLFREDISPEGINKIGGVCLFNDHIYLLLQSNLLYNGKELEASEAVSISQKYPVWDVYLYNPENGTIANQSKLWKTTQATPNGFSIVDSSTVFFINEKNQLTSNNKELREALKQLQDKKIIFADPSINALKNKIWFSADLPGGLGGMDLWYVEKSDEEWGNPINAGNQVNSADNEISPSVLRDSVLIFSSNRFNKNYDLYFFNLKTNELIHHEEIPDSTEFYTSIDSTGTLLFLSRKGKNSKLWKSKWSVARAPEMEVMKAPKIESVPEKISPKEELVIKKPETKIEESTNIQMTNYFGLARYNLTPYMKDSLNRLAKTLQEDPDLSILICGHASPDGPENLNMMLSYYRANEAYNWLISQHIADSRIYRVYGGEYLFNGTQKARNFSIFTLETPELPSQIALYPVKSGEDADAVATRMGTSLDDMSYQRYQLNKFLPLKNERLLLIPVNLLYMAKKGEQVVEIARQYNIPPSRLKTMNELDDAPLKADQVLYIVY